ncbi:hypothetical protein RUM44_004310 [Polyplax serrata]|uniref:Uncharacterized protein n=1 Tax=Polyplax serrata TaxID=468196 RepID=A0ABR1B2U6_POLSC
MIDGYGLRKSSPLSRGPLALFPADFLIKLHENLSGEISAGYGIVSVCGSGRGAVATPYPDLLRTITNASPGGHLQN